MMVQENPATFKKQWSHVGNISMNSLNLFLRCQSKCQQMENCNPYDINMFPITQNVFRTHHWHTLNVLDDYWHFLIINILQSQIFSIPWIYLYRDLKQCLIDKLTIQFLSKYSLFLNSIFRGTASFGLCL